ncbi:heavy-metal-associated domain-containing protein [Maribacter stanieri]|uniref:Copper chaperone CopZ n=1 Tax=Maribacter stanieri TaxID=440514 RepID=A0A1I6HIV7_9FLAO|nr:heavy-metal-associated domain-containing protein [Maribacter stanieri]SFR54230.1 Copper chaperone CopZ [Maribacter stanieri]
MKFKLLFLGLALFVLATNVSQAQESPIKIENRITNTIVVNIDGMACQEGCADKIASNLKTNDGVISADISFENKNGIIVYDPSLISIEQVKSVITDTKVKDYNYTINSVKTQDNN